MTPEELYAAPDMEDGIPWHQAVAMIGEPFELSGIDVARAAAEGDRGLLLVPKARRQDAVAYALLLKGAAFGFLVHPADEEEGLVLTDYRRFEDAKGHVGQWSIGIPNGSPKEDAPELDGFSFEHEPASPAP